MNHTPLISVVVPIYKVENYLRRCVDSILAQTYQNMEIILVNDGSPDNSLAICREYARADKRVHVVDKQNGGLGSARNAGIAIMKGEYVLFIDSDDYISPHMAEKLYTLIEEHDADISVCRFCRFYEDQAPQPKGEVEITTLSGADALREMFYPDRIRWGAWNKMYRASLFDGVRYAEGVYSEDMATTYLLYEKCDRIVCTTEELYYYFINRNGIMKSKPTKRYADEMVIIETMIDYFQKNHPERVRDAQAFCGKLAPNALVMLVANDAYPEIQEKCCRAVRDYVPLAIRADFVRSKYKIKLLAFRMLVCAFGQDGLKRDRFRTVCKKLQKYTK